VSGITRVSRVVADLGRAEAFYRDALGFSAITRQPTDAATLAALGAGRAEEMVMRLGAEEIALVQFAEAGRAAPPDSRSDDLWFQHLAVVVADMDAAYAHLRGHEGWTPISDGGPQALPPANGAVRAMKFRDPDFHPLELIWFPPGQGRPVWQQADAPTPFLGIDHSALSISNTPRSLDFYRALGFSVSARSLNHGPAQALLDALPQAQVRVTALRPPAAESMGLELLRYRPPGRALMPLAPAQDLVTDWVTLAVDGRGVSVLRDPDGHRFVLARP
jgi:catechol 2,3-dioxygenase-like lactoylglutathione lyase family enzyme